jgi:hypothetical protein
MSIFGSIVSKIFGGPKAEPAAGAPATPASGAPTVGATPGTSQAPSPRDVPATESAAGSSAAGSSAAPQVVDVEAVLTGLAAGRGETLNWRQSIVDLMKLLELDSSLNARKQLAQELHYTGDMNDSASMNIWLHEQVMLKLAESGGKVPESLRTSR